MRKIIIAASSDHKIVKVPVGSVAIPRDDLDAAIQALKGLVASCQSPVCKECVAIIKLTERMEGHRDAS